MHFLSIVNVVSLILTEWPTLEDLCKTKFILVNNQRPVSFPHKRKQSLIFFSVKRPKVSVQIKTEEQKKKKKKKK